MQPRSIGRTVATVAPALMDADCLRLRDEPGATGWTWVSVRVLRTSCPRDRFLDGFLQTTISANGPSSVVCRFN